MVVALLLSVFVELCVAFVSFLHELLPLAADNHTERLHLQLWKHKKQGEGDIACSYQVIFEKDII